jgi:hypothetical protein
MSSASQPRVVPEVLTLVNAATIFASATPTIERAGTQIATLTYTTPICQWVASFNRDPDGRLFSVTHAVQDV